LVELGGKIIFPWRAYFLSYKVYLVPFGYSEFGDEEKKM
jgi:hypothetical protein